MSYIFNGATKEVTLVGTITLDVRDLYSRWIEWASTSDNSKYLNAFLVLGGEDIDVTEGIKIPPYIFITNGWKIAPMSTSHTLTVVGGILLVDGGGDPFKAPTGSYSVQIIYRQPVQAVSFSTGGSGGSVNIQQIVDGVLNGIIDNNVNLKNTLRALLSATTGTTQYIGTNTEKYLSNDGLETILEVTYDNNNNRIISNVNTS